MPPKKAAQIIDGQPVAQDATAAAAAEAAAQAAKDAPWTCVPCYRAGTTVQLKDKAQGDPTGRLQCPQGHSWWGKTGLDAA